MDPAGRVLAVQLLGAGLLSLVLDGRSPVEKSICLITEQEPEKGTAMLLVFDTAEAWYWPKLPVLAVVGLDQFPAQFTAFYVS